MTGLRAVLVVSLLVVGCGPADGAVFVDVPEPLDLSCDGQLGDDVEGDDPRFEQECGYRCDSDWCACDACRMLSGPLARMSAGEHELRVEGGSSGSATFELQLTLEDGTVVFEEARTYNGLFDDSFVFTVPGDCPVLYTSWTLQTDVCSRIYAFEIDPGAM